jgi:hypothetical protein
MLTLAQITEVEVVYIARHERAINDDLFAFIINRYDATNVQPFIYLKWLMERWTVLRKYDHQLPTRIIDHDYSPQRLVYESA